MKVCDGCKQAVCDDFGGAHILIRNPSPDYAADFVPAYRTPSQLDLCADCTVRMVAFFSLSADTFTPRPKSIENPPPKGALTDDELAALGLVRGDL